VIQPMWIYSILLVPSSGQDEISLSYKHDTSVALNCIAED